MDFQISQEDGFTVAQLSGRLTFQENAEFRTLVDQLDPRGRGLLLDLRELEFIDSAGLGMLLVMRDSSEHDVVLRTAEGQVSRLLNLARFSDFFRLES